MKKVLKYLKITMAFLFISATLLSTGIVTAQAEETGYETANLDIVNGIEVYMPITSTGVVVDGHQLNHDYVKILNINNGSILINDETYTQESVSEPWSTQDDAYVIKGKGTSSNNITIYPTGNEITVYLVDLEWNGQLIIDGNPCKVNVVVCGNIKNFNASAFINVQRFSGSLFVSGLTGTEDNVTSKIFLLHYFNSTSPLESSRTVNLKDITINTTSFYTRYTFESNNYTNATLDFDNVVLNNEGTFYNRGFAVTNVNNSIIKQFDINTPILNSTNSVIHFRSPVVGVVNSTNSTLSLNSPTPSTFSKINLQSSSMFYAINFVGTPVDNNANDLYLKKIRLRQHSNTFLWISIDNGPEAKLQTDSNGFIYPYVKTGTTRIDARLEDGQAFYATFPATTGTDNTPTSLLKAAESNPTITGYSNSQNVNVGETLSLFVTVTPGTAGSSLSYQWYKDNVLLPNETQSTLTKNEAVTNDSGIYKCAVKENNGGTVTSEKIEVIVSRPESSRKPTISSQTSDMDLIAGSNVALIINAVPSVATNTLSYQWYQNNTPIDVTSNRLALTNITIAQAGSYKCVVTEENLNTTAESEVVTILVRESLQ